MHLKNYYITTPIYYVNDKPHIGHAYTSLACDLVARFKRLDGYNVKFLTGTDEHGQKVQKSAIKKNLSPQDFTDQISQSFRDLIKTMHFSPDDFIRTTEERHKNAASYFWNILSDNGYIYKGEYSGWYSIRDESFYTEDELIDGKAPTGAEVEWSKEETYFFKLSAFQDKLLDFYKKNPDFIAPKSRMNEVISFVQGGKEYQSNSLLDLSISRTSFSWGIPVPGDDKHIMYVWLDALTNYLSALNYPNIENNLYKQFWPADLHIVGKDILRFHAVYWPAFLMAAKLPLPKKIFAHGWWTNEGEKISKSVGNVIDPNDLIKEFGLDQIRYFLMKHITFGNDGNYSRQELIRHLNSDLANNIGNLVQRVLSMIQKNFQGNIPDNDNLLDRDNKLLQVSYDLLPNLRILIDNQSFNIYIEKIVTLSSLTNEYIDKEAPWNLKKDNPERMANILYTLSETIRVIAIYLLPVIPNSAAQILSLLSVEDNQRSFSYISKEYALKSGTMLPSPNAIFPKYVD